MMIRGSQVRFGVESSIRQQDFTRSGQPSEELDEAGRKALAFVKNALLGNMVTERLMQTESDKVELLLRREPARQQGHMQPTPVEDEFVVAVRENIPGGREHRQSFKIHKIVESEQQAQFLRFFQNNIVRASHNVREYLNAKYPSL